MKRTLWILTLLLAASLLLVACGAPAGEEPVAEEEEAAPAEEEAAPEEEEAMEPGTYYERAMAGEFDGTVVTMTGPFTDEDAVKFDNSVAAFEEATGIDIQYEGSKEFEASIGIRVEAGDPPDIVDFPQPGLLATFVAQGEVVDVSTFLPEESFANYNQSWWDMATMAGPDGPIVAGVWHRFNAKSQVWYPQEEFEAAGYEIPETWDDLVALSDQIVADGDTPWCVGIESGAATGWPATDWMEEVMLRTTSLENYDKWVTGELPFSSDEVKNALTVLSELWADEYVYGGQEAIVTTFFGDAPTPMFEDPPKCWLHKQGNFITSFFPEGVEAGTDYGFFYLPGIDEAYGKPYLVAGDIMAMFNDRDEVRAVMEFFTKGEAVKEWLAAGGALSPHMDTDLDWYGDDIERGIAALVAEATSVRFDGSDLMPGEVGAGSFWKGMTDYFAGVADMDTVMAEIDASWPHGDMMEEGMEEGALPDLEGREITVAVENAYLPFNYIDPDTGEPAGWDYEVWDELCELLNCVPVYVEAAWEGMIQAVADGQFDAAADGITITEERDEIVDFSTGYVAIEQRLLVRVDEDRIESIDDIVANEELKLGTQTGTTNYETASEYLPEERISAFEQFPFAVQALIAGDIDAVIIDEVAGQGYLGENAESLKLVGDSLSSDFLGFIFPEGSDLVEPINAGIEELAKNGFLEEVNAKYFGPDFSITYDDLFPPEEEEAAAEDTGPFLACQVTDVGGIDDKSFNATAWKGMEDAVADFGIEAKYLESQQQTDYEVNINAFVEEGCDLIMSVGFLLGDATAAAAEANPDQMFGIVDVNWLSADNLYGSGFAINEATFLAGYLAAGMTETGIVATYGGINIPPVAVFMDGFVQGVEHYNKVHGTEVQVLGWDIATQDGLFVGNFESTDDGRTMGESLMDEGADIIMPVAGPVGAGTLAVMEERGAGWIIGVDNDWSVQFENQAEYVLASALKNMDLYVYETIKAAMDGTFAGGNYLGTLENGGVGLGYGGVEVPEDLKAEIEALVPGIIDGSIFAPAEGLGSEGEPIKVLFVPSVDVDFMISSGALIEKALQKATGHYYEVSVPTSYAATIEEMCASPADTIGFIPAMGYALANQLCGVEPGLASVRYGWNVYWAEFLVARDSDYETLADLEGATWAYPDAGSTSGFLFPSALFEDLGITIGETLEAGGHPQAVKAVYNGEADVATAFFSPPLLPEGKWEIGMAPDVPDELVPDCGLNEAGKLFCGDIRVLDARSAIREEAPDVVQKVRILDISAEIPNDTMSFSPDFPEDLRQTIMDAVIAYVGSPACAETLCNENFYDWTGAAPIFDENFDGIRLLLESQGITLENIGG